MSTIPHGLTPEAMTWVRAQVFIASAQAVAPIETELRRMEEWGNGLFIVLVQMLPYLLKSHPEMAMALATEWRKVAEDCDRIERQGVPEHSDEPLEFLEARRILFTVLNQLGLWPAVDANGSGLVKTPRNRRYG